MNSKLPSALLLVVLAATLIQGNALAQNCMDYLNALQKSLSDIQRVEEEEAARRRAEALEAQRRAQTQAVQQQRLQASQQAQQVALLQRQQLEQDIAQKRALLAQKKIELEDLRARQRQMDQLARTPNPWDSQ